MKTLREDKTGCNPLGNIWALRLVSSVTTQLIFMKFGIPIYWNLFEIYDRYFFFATKFFSLKKYQFFKKFPFFRILFLELIIFFIYLLHINLYLYSTTKKKFLNHSSTLGVNEDLAEKYIFSENERTSMFLTCVKMLLTCSCTI